MRFNVNTKLQTSKLTKPNLYSGEIRALRSKFNGMGLPSTDKGNATVVINTIVFYEKING